MTDEAKKKASFRKTSKWKNWRKHLKTKRKTDEVTGKPLYKGWQCHHFDMRIENYEDLREEKFACLNKQTHEVVHWMFRYKNWKEIIYNLSKILTEMEKYRDDANN